MTTPEQHNKYLALAHFAYGGLQTLLILAMAFIFLIVIADGGSHSQMPFGLFLIVIGAVIFSLIFTLPSLVAGYGFWKRKSWARTAGIVAGVLAAMNAPIGTAVCVYTFWFLFSDPGKVLYDRPNYALPPQPPVFSSEGMAQKYRDFASRTPPDWR